MQLSRASGVLLHPTSLPSPFGLGDLGLAARTFIERLAQSGQRWWQLLPLTAPGSGGSPYSSISAFAGNTALIDPVALHTQGWVSQQDLDTLKAATAHHDPTLASIDEATAAKQRLIEQAYKTWASLPDDIAKRADFDAFCQAQAHWLEDFSLFAAIRRDQPESYWIHWPKPLILREAAALDEQRAKLKDAINTERFAQWVFSTQWEALRAFAHSKNVKLIGDIPIFVAMDSADAWARPDIFLLKDGQAKVVSGVPPDYFSKTGQKWGNPLYDWKALKAQDYAWWVERVKQAITQVDIARIDHFRGFEAYWEVPEAAPTAQTGRWVKGPGDAFFYAIKRNLGEVPFIAEDLGLITPEVTSLRDRHNLPGMKVMHFAFGGEADHPFLPHTYPRHCVAYAGTHDNDTTRGWFDALDEAEKHRVRVYLSTSNDQVVSKLIERLLQSRADLVILTAQDLYGLGAWARMNIPSTVDDNWRWRMTQEQLDHQGVWQRLGQLTQQASR